MCRSFSFRTFILGSLRMSPPYSVNKVNKWLKSSVCVTGRFLPDEWELQVLKERKWSVVALWIDVNKDLILLEHEVNCTRDRSIVGQRLHTSLTVTRSQTFWRLWESVSINDKQVELWAKLMSEKTPTNISFISLQCSLLPHSEVYVASRLCLFALSAYLA